ncbi:MAG TPA: VgrG-related protein [Jatrophihabitans sp.]|nr:VgrG-related protein [Jatrophihabitans sp.]
MPVSNAFLVTVDGSPLPADVEGLLASAVVDDSLRLPDLFTLRFRDPQRGVLEKSGLKVGSVVTVSVMTADEQTPGQLIKGEVTAVEAEFDSNGTFTIVRGYDHAHRLFRGRRTATYTQVTASDVVTTVVRRAGLQVGKIDSTSTVFDHLSQAGTTDWEFVDGLAREIGYEIAVRDGALDFQKPPQASDAPAATGTTTNPLVLQQGRDLLRFRAVVTSAAQVKEVEVRGWDVASKKALKATHPAATTSAVLPGATPADLAHTFGDPVYVATDVPYRTQAEVDAAAAALADQIAGSFAEFEAVAHGNPQLRAGAAISIDALGAPFDGKYTITTSRHRYESDTGYTTSFAVTGRQERSLYGLTSGASGAQDSLGMVVGQISDAKDPQSQGRVKLAFPWLSDDYVSDWARTVQAGAGKDRGAMVVPEVGDEVLVGFEQGDVRRPYVLGGLYNGIDTPKTGGIDVIDSGSGAVNRRSVISRRGHRIDLLDQDGSTEGVSIQSADEKLKVVLDAVGTSITVHSDGSVTIEGQNGVVVDAGGGKLDLKGSQISLTAQNGITADGGAGPVSIKSAADLSLQGMSASLQGNSQTTVNGGAMCTITAGLVKINC